jgi:replicative DNA helicase
MNQQKLLRISQVADAMSEKYIYIDDSGTNTALDIRAKSRRLKAELADWTSSFWTTSS